MTDTLADSSNNIGGESSPTANAATARQSESPARTIDSHDSTTGSMDTIVDRSGHINQQQQLAAANIEQSTNTTNAQQQRHDSLTNSQISMLHQQSASSSDEEQQQQQLRQLQMQQQQQQQQQQAPLPLPPFDAQSHIYSSPVYDQKPPPLKLTAAKLLTTATTTAAENNKNLDAAASAATQKPKLITHEEFQQQLQDAVAARGATLDSRISKKQRFPPELIKIKDSDGGGGAGGKIRRVKRSKAPRSSAACCSAFPLQIVLGLLQLLLAISLVALGSLLIVRDASLSTAGCGIWTGLTAAVTGSLGVVSLRKTQTAFLALSLVCIATSTLALAISGVGLSRDINRMEEDEKFELMNSNSEISAASGLIFTLFLHFVVSIVSVYRCALQVCAR